MKRGQLPPMYRVIGMVFVGLLVLSPIFALLIPETPRPQQEHAEKHGPVFGHFDPDGTISWRQDPHMSLDWDDKDFPWVHSDHSGYIVPGEKNRTIQESATSEPPLNWHHYKKPLDNPYKKGDIVYATLDFEKICDCTDIAANTRGEVVESFETQIVVQLPDGKLHQSSHAWWAPRPNE